jgi:hypothetical protein
MKIFLAVLLGVVAAADINATSSIDFNANPCNPVITSCDGQWACKNGVVPVNHPKYGIICQIENGNESFSVGMTEMCPLGGSLGTDLMCQLVRQASSFGCPDFTETINSSFEQSTECLIKYPVFCPKGYTYFKEVSSCKRFEQAQCIRNLTDCGNYYCRDGSHPIYLDYSSNDWPVCVLYKYIPLTSSAASEMSCNTDELFINKECLAVYDAFYKPCPSVTPTSTISPSASASVSSMPSREPLKPSESPVPSREIEKPSESPVPSREIEKPSESPVPSREIEKPSESPSPSNELNSTQPCFEYICPSGILPTTVNITNIPICIYSKYDAIANSAGYLECRNGGILHNKYCYIYEPAHIVPCNSTQQPVDEIPSMTPSPSQVSKPSETPLPSVPCGRYTCPDGIEVKYTSLFTYPICEFGTYEAMPMADGGHPCGEGDILIENNCLHYMAAVFAPCSNFTSPVPSREPEKPSESPIPSRELEKPSESSIPSQSSTPSQSSVPSESPVPSQSSTPSQYMIPSREPEKPSESPVPSRPCGEYICPDGLIPRYFDSFKEPICVYSQYDVTSMADGTMGCPRGGIQLGNYCVLFEPAIFVECNSTTSATPSATPSAIPVKPSESSTPTREPEKPSESSTPTREPEKPSESSTPSREPEKPSASSTSTKSAAPSKIFDSPTASPTPIKEPVITATVTIRINTDLTQNTSSNMTAFEDPVVLFNLRDAISKALGVPVELIVIESVTWMNDGNVMSTVRLYNTTAAGAGRRLGAVDNYDIKYKVINPPESLIALPPEQLASKIETSSVVMAAAANAISAATGVEITQNNIQVQSTEMAVLRPVVETENNSATSSKLPSGAIIGGAGAGVLVIGGALVAAAITYNKKKRARKVKSLKTTAVPQKQGNVVEIERVIINPLQPGIDTEHPFMIQNRHFSQQMSIRDMDAVFGPRQARRSFV